MLGTHSDDDDDDDGLWADYWAASKHDGAPRERLLVHYTPLVEQAVEGLTTLAGARWEGLARREDLVSYGLFGLADAIEAFRPRGGTDFETFATVHIQAAIFNELRMVARGW